MDFNKVIIAGRLTREPEMKYLGSGNAFCAWGMAVNRYYNDNNGERQQETCFIDVKAFGRQAEIVAEYVTKGNPLFVEGRLSFYQYEDENGQRRNKLSVIAERVQLLPKINGSISAGGTGRFVPSDNHAVSNFPEEPPEETKGIPAVHEVTAERSEQEAKALPSEEQQASTEEVPF